MTLGSFRIFSKIRRYSQVKVQHRCQRHRWQIAAGINNTGGKFATGIKDTGGKFCYQFPLCTGGKYASGVNDTGGKLPPVSTTPEANLPPVSLTPVANYGNNIRLQTPESELEGKHLYICFLYYPKVTKQNY
jgi:hypothetical protein